MDKDLRIITANVSGLCAARLIKKNEQFKAEARVAQNPCYKHANKVMIEAEELRIGNFLEFLGKVIQVECISNLEKRPDMYWIKPIGMIPSKIFHFHPIKLTEELILEYSQNSIFNNGYTYKITSTGRFEILLGFSLVTVIEFLHEFQNLNFALLGEEVTTM